MPKALHQIIAIEKNVKQRVYSEVGDLFKSVQKPELFNGLSRTYQPINDDGENLPPETKRVQITAEVILARLAQLHTEAMDVEAAKDWTNLRARADVVIDDKVLIKDAPATYLLYLEKQLTDLRTFIGQLPVLDEAESWKKDESSPLHRAETQKTHRTRKVQKPIVLYQATDKHPAQTQLITEDVIDGHWTIAKTSGAIPMSRGKELMERVNKLTDAVKMAREQANATAVEEPKVGSNLFAFLFR
jgi:hypothetical protein